MLATLLAGLILTAVLFDPGQRMLYVVGSDALTRGLEEGRVPWLLVGIVLAVGAGLVFAARLAHKRLGDRPAAPAEDRE